MRYEKRYASKWQEISVEAKKATGWYCCYPGCQEKATQTHHAMYRDKEGAIAGREVPGVHVFPLCDLHHGRDDLLGAHHPKNWYTGVTGGARLDSRQRVHYYRKLAEGFDSKALRRKRA